MNAIKYLHNRFSFAVKNNGTIKVNQQDIEAINKLVELEKNRNTDLEDSLMLYYIFLMYTVENENNMVKIKEKGAENVNYPLGINTPYSILCNLSKKIDPKSYVIEKIYDELWIYQEYERIPEEIKKQKLDSYRLGDWVEDLKEIKSQNKNIIPIPREGKITLSEVTELMENVLKVAKEDFSKINLLSKGVLWKS